MLSRIQIGGFKAIKDSGKIALGPMTLLIGRNGTGKSSLIEAIQFLQEALLKGVTAAVAERFGSFDDLLNRRSRDISFALTLEGDHREVRYGLRVGESGVLSESCKEDRTKATETTIVTRSGGRAGAQVRVIRGGNPVRNHDLLALQQVARTSARGAERLLDFIRRAVFLRLSPATLAQRDGLALRARGPVLDEEGRGLVALLHSLSSVQRRTVTQRIAEVIPGVEGIQVHASGSQGQFATRERMIARGGNKQFEIPALLLSEGTRRLTAIHALLVVEPKPSMIVIEEIENGLDPWTLQGVFHYLRCAADDGVQIIATTHSPFLLDHVDPGDVLYAERLSGDTKYRYVTDIAETARYSGIVAPGAMYVSGLYSARRSNGRGGA